MATNGIGASVRRKEDQRFITGTGHFTDDIDRPGQVYAYFVRRPMRTPGHPRHDKSLAEAAPGGSRCSPATTSRRPAGAI